MRRLVFALPGNEALARRLAAGLGATLGRATVRRFPDGECYVRVGATVRGREVILVCTLDRPNDKFLSLYFIAGAIRDLGATRVGLVCPYLPYMRQDKTFRKGEAVTSVSFADIMSRTVDWIVTVDPHLHRWPDLSSIYRVPAIATHAAPLVASWIRDHVRMPLIVGPDAESAQWAAAVARDCGGRSVVLRKNRSGDRRVTVSDLPMASRPPGTPVVMDDIISTGHTMIQTVQKVRAAGYPRPYCIGIHGIFAESAYAKLKSAGARQIVSSNTVPHPTNAIDVTSLLVDAVTRIGDSGSDSRAVTR
ncbi:MAG TPA: ribose-phosphate pyrophosphokinase [Vineibacter sp.]|nr:ribose-phosphate pyrophosphokinase [Vineibacter sp.]